MARNIERNPYDIVLDTEMTDTKNGAAMEVAAIRFVPNTGIIVGRYSSGVRVPTNVTTNEYGQLHYNKVADMCRNSPSEDCVALEFLDWMRGDRRYAPPEIYGYCIENRDLPVLKRQFGYEQEWIATAKIHDIATTRVFHKFPTPTKDNGAMPRTLPDVAKALGVPVDVNRLHDPLYDCELTLAVKVALDKVDAGEKTIVTPLPAGKPPVRTEAVKAIEGDDGQMTYEETKARFNDPKYKKIRCPVCGGTMTARINSRCKGTPDEFFYCCDNPNHKNDAGTYGFSINLDGTKGPQHKTQVCNVDDQLLTN